MSFMIKLDWIRQDVPQSNEVVLKIMLIDNIYCSTKV